jgi:hypothetical protein
MKHATWQFPTVQLELGPHSSMEHPPPEHEPSLQAALAPSHFRKQPLTQEAISHLLPAVHVLIEHPPSHAPTLHLALVPVHASEQPPMQLLTEHVAPWHGIVQAPVWLQSTLQVEPGLQFV